jgi:hypothetical protein
VGAGAANGSGGKRGGVSGGHRIGTAARPGPGEELVREEKMGPLPSAECALIFLPSAQRAPSSML